jgi:hypothetical protein
VVLIILYNFSYLYDTLSSVPFTRITWGSFETINVLGQFSTAVVGTLVQSAYTAEIIRGGFLGSITVSMKRPRHSVYRPGVVPYVILPQALRTILPPDSTKSSASQRDGDGLRAGDAGTVLHHSDDLQPHAGGDPTADGGRSVVSGDHHRVVRYSACCGTRACPQRTPFCR